MSTFNSAIQSRILQLVYSVEEQISARDDYVCPAFTNEIRIVDAVHPLLEGNVRNTMAVPNNIVRICLFTVSEEMSGLASLNSTYFCCKQHNFRLERPITIFT